jgi:single-strand DNA-binding protein
VTTFTLAASRSWTTNDGERHTETEWFNIVTWSNLAEICKQYLTKGMQVYIEGRLQTRHWEDKEKNKHSTVEIIANEMMILGDRRESNNQTGMNDYSSVSDDSRESNSDDEFPF